ncbi:transcriptional regulator, TetR family [Methanobacterium lacus]|uniref:Transcriptional regulator, TetR family n=1 Tax=Methanobacterium lacus (strain AL-21) TaxID=877455 RepID=F0T8C0_METLA|nr:TetR/AcrR family transcriptional regulator [Methanobacterium lacus]ADZ08532.1 transcriptional regulator, TetR family [Methanobacterium lacus]
MKKENSPQETLTTKERIFEASVNLFSQKGFDAVSMREIGREVGIRESSIYNHYKNKDAILENIINHLIDELGAISFTDEEMDALISESPELFFETGSREFFNGMSNPKTEKIWRILSIEVFHNEKIKTFFVNELLESPINEWEKIFTKMMKKGIIKEYDPRVLAREYFSFALYLFFEYFILKYDTKYSSFTDMAYNKMIDHTNFILKTVKIESNDNSNHKKS